MSGIEEIKNKLQAFKRRFYLKQLLVGSLLFLIIGLSMFFMIAGLEYQLWMNSGTRTILFFLPLALMLFLIVWLIFFPLSTLLKIRKGLTDEAAASEVSRFFPELEDKLLNTLQLSNLTDNENLLLHAALDKKANQFKHVRFIKAVDFSKGKKYGLFLASILLCMLLVSFINPSILKDSTNRIIKYDQEFIPSAPFSFRIDQKLIAFRGEDFKLTVNIDGPTIPEKLHLVNESGQKLRLEKSSSTTFTYTFPSLQSPKKFQLEGSGFYSANYTLLVEDRPDLVAMEIMVESPSYTGEEKRTITNSGDITVLEGSKISWYLNTLSADSISFSLGEGQLQPIQNAKNQYVINKKIFDNTKYTIDLYNPYGKNASEIDYNIEVVKDENPQITAEYFPDTTSFRYVTLAGSIADDYGFSSLILLYQKENKEQKRISLDFSSQVQRQSFYVNWNIDSLNLEAGENLEFYVLVGDNDQINGSKTARTKTFVMQVPDEKEIDELLEKKSETVESQLDKSQSEAEKINERLKELEERLRSEQKFGWQEKTQLNKIIKGKEKLEEQIEELKKQHESLQKSNDQFKQRSDKIQQQNEKTTKYSGRST